MALSLRERNAYERLLIAFDNWARANAPFIAHTTNGTLYERFCNFFHAVQDEQELARSYVGKPGVTCGWCGERHSLERVKVCRKNAEVKLVADREAAIDWLTNLLNSTEDDNGRDA